MSEASEGGVLFDELLDGSYDCIDRVVLRAYFRFGPGAAGFSNEDLAESYVPETPSFQGILRPLLAAASRTEPARDRRISSLLDQRYPGDHREMQNLFPILGMAA